jgi:hypothetical protein
MAVSCDQVKAYATQFLPQFVFATSERVFPVSAESWLLQCAEDDWTDPTSPHRGTTDVIAELPLQLTNLTGNAGCQGAGGTPIDPGQPLGISDAPRVQESFLDFAGWFSLTTNDGFTEGDDTYIRQYYSSYFAQFNSSLGIGEQTPPTRTVPTLPTKPTIYCEAAWAGDFTRLAITGDLGDFAVPPTADPTNLTPDTRLDPYFVLTYYLFYPCTEPPPTTSVPITSSNRLSREGQWEAVSFFFKSTSQTVASAGDLALPSDPTTVTPAYAVLSLGITNSGDGLQLAGLATSYPAQVGSWGQGGQVVISGGFPSFGKEIEPQPVYVTSGTHKNLFTPTPTSSTSSSDPGWTAAGGVAEGVGGALLPAWPVGTIVGGLLLLLGFLMQFFGKDTTTSPLPDGSGDVATSNGPVANAGAPSTASGAPSVDIDLKVVSTLPDNASCVPPPWWSYAGRWGVAVSSGAASWDSGGRRIDFRGRSRAYWNTVWLQTAL